MINYNLSFLVFPIQIEKKKTTNETQREG
jgi:hypothetical protein